MTDNDFPADGPLDDERGPDAWDQIALALGTHVALGGELDAKVVRAAFMDTVARGQLP